MISFGPWEIEKREYADKCAALERAALIEEHQIIALDAERQSITIAGSGGDHFATLQTCDCAGSSYFTPPCKHMIRLAMELGCAFDVPAFDKYAASEYDVQEDIDRLTDRWMAGQLTLDALRKCTSELRKSAKQSRKRPGRPKKVQG